MEQSITLTIAGKVYPLKANSPEMEQLMRLAAETINQKLSVYDAKFPTNDLIDKVIFVTLNETVSRLNLQRKLSAETEKERQLLAETQNYLDGIEK